jgi:hypothetical protein
VSRPFLYNTATSMIVENVCVCVCVCVCCCFVVDSVPFTVLLRLFDYTE